MIPCPHVLVIGAAGRNVGKTEFACAVIRRLATAGRPVVGVKVTTVHERQGSCPRGGAGCGACTEDLEAGWAISEAAPAGDDKDTTRMLRAGASAVLWLRAAREHLEAGFRDLLGRVPAGALVVCESNSVRAVAQPGLFLVLRDLRTSEVKPSCRAVLSQADRVVAFDGAGWDLAPEEIAPAGGRWLVRPRATAVVLAGGESRRMGVDKAMLDAGGRPLIAHVLDQLAFFPERLVGANDRARFAFLGLDVVGDPEPGQGPLGGILACVDRAAHELCFVTSCDVPEIEPAFVLGLLGQAAEHDVVVPRWADGRVEPLLAVYRKTVVPVARGVLARGGRRIIDVFAHLRVRFVPVESLGWYRNLNTPDDYLRWAGQPLPPRSD